MKKSIIALAFIATGLTTDVQAKTTVLLLTAQVYRKQVDSTEILHNI